jgi:HEAT repeat protein
MGVRRVKTTVGATVVTAIVLVALCAATTHAPNVPAGVTALTASLSDPDAVVRGLCALELAKLGPTAAPALPALIARLQDSDPSVRMASANGIRMCAALWASRSAFSLHPS